MERQKESMLVGLVAAADFLAWASVLRDLITRRISPARSGTAVANDWLKPGSTQTVRCKGAALTLLVRHTGKSATPVILSVARNDSDMKLRAKAISVLGQSNDDSVIDALREFALNSPDTDISEAALYALSQHSSERAMGVLGEIATSNRPIPLRRAAIQSISGRPGEPAVDEDVAGFVGAVARLDEIAVV